MQHINNGAYSTIDFDPGNSGMLIDLKAKYGMNSREKMEKVIMKKTITDLDINPFR